jgi:hypothetical protein
MLSRPQAGSSARPRISLVSLLAFDVLAFLAYYVLGGFEQSLEKVKSAEANRMAIQAKDNPNNLSRSQYDRQRAGQSGNAVQNSNSLGEARSHNEEVRQMMQAGQGGEPQH